MPDVSQSTKPASTLPGSQPGAVAPPPEAPPSSKSRGSKTVRVIIGVIVALAAILVVGFIIALILAFTNPGAAAGLEILRDFFIITLTLEGLLIGVALIVLVLQIARLINLLQNEIRPILEETSDTVRTVKGTASFVSRNVADPVIRASGFLAFLGAFLKELFRIFRLVR